MLSLPKDLTITLVSGYSVAMRHRIVTRWHELEQEESSGFQIPKTMTEALRLALQPAEQLEVQQAAQPVLDAFTSKGQDGFTMIVDPRNGGNGGYIGVRLQYVPEISMRWDEAARAELLAEGGIERVLAEKMRLLNDISAEVSDLDGVAYAGVQRYDTLVIGKENYDEYIGGRSAGGDSKAGGKVWFGQQVRKGLEAAVRRYEGDGRQDGAGGVSDVGGEGATRLSRVGIAAGPAELAGRPNSGGRAGKGQAVAGAIHYGRQGGLSKPCSGRGLTYS